MFRRFQQPPLAFPPSSEAGYGATAAAAPSLCWREGGGQIPQTPCCPAAGSALDHSPPQLPQETTGLPGAACFFAGAPAFAQPGPGGYPAFAPAEQHEGFAGQHQEQQFSHVSSTSSGEPPVPEDASLEDFLASCVRAPGASSHRRPRTVYSREVLEVLEEAFLRNMRPGLRQREQLAALTRIPEDRLQVWFQNRRAKYRKARKACSNP